MSLTIAVLGEDGTVPLVATVLRQLGFQVRTELGEPFDVAVIDRIDPVAAIRAVRERDDTAPIVLLGALSAEADMVVSKPVRAHALARHIATAAATTGLAFGRWRFYPKIRLLKDSGGNSETLTQKESEMLEYLLQADRLVSRDELLTEVFGYAVSVSTHTVETHIHTLRKKLGADLLVTEDAGYSVRG